jgi:hypothetical protein
MRSSRSCGIINGSTRRNSFARECNNRVLVLSEVSFMFRILLLLATASFSFGQLRISQVYGGGGNTGATLKNDFIEVFNAGAASVSVNGMSVQYASTSGTTWQVTNLPNRSLAPGQYLLVQEAVGAGGTTNLPTPDAIGTIAMAAGAGKVALVTVTTALSGACPTTNVVDFIGYGTGTNCFEGATTATLTNITAAIRNSGGCVDSNNNSSDFTVAAPNPRNTASPANPCGGSVLAGASTLLTVAVTPGTNPASTGLAVAADLTSIGGSATQQFFDDGTHGDAVAGDNTFSFQATVGGAITAGLKSIPATITDTQSRTGSASIALTVTSNSTPPTATTLANPNSLLAGASTLLTVTVTPGTNPASTGIGVNANLSSIGGSATQQFFDDGSNGDVTGGDNIFSFSTTVALGTTSGAKSLPVTVTDAQSRSSSTAISLTVQSPPAPTTVKISQAYGGGGNSGSTYKNDFIEIFNQASTPIDISGWSVQYASANQQNWQVTPVCASAPCVIAPGHYFLIQELAGASGTTFLPTADAIGTIPMGAGSAQAALVDNITPLTGICPTNVAIVDFVGYGASGCPNPMGSALSNTTAAVRKGNGCIDTDNDHNDFVIIGPIPRNSSAPPNSCAADPTQITGLGTASPASLEVTASTLLAVALTPATTPPSTGIAVTADLTAIGGSASQQFFDDGTHGDLIAGDNVFSVQAFIGAAIPTGVKYLIGHVTDNQNRVANIPITLTVESPTCGFEYWNIKTGTDADALTINLSSIIPTTINDLRVIPIPYPPSGDRPKLADGQSATRIPSTEFTVYQIAGTLTFYKLETDVDYHMVLQDQSGNTIIGEVPSPACIGAGSPFGAGVANARAKVDARLTPAGGFQTANLPVRVTGVGFFDILHGQTGVAPNGIELHPMLDVNFTKPTATSLISALNASQFGQTVAITATVSNGGTPAPTGQLTLLDGGSAIGTATLDASAMATFNISNFSTGSHTLTATYPGDSTSAPSTSAPLIQVVNKADQTITFAPLGGKTFGDADFAVSATASSGLAVTFSIASGPATVTGNLVHITGAGAVTVRASQPGDTNYNAAPNVDQPFTVGKANQTITFAPLPDKTFGDAPFTVSATGGASTQTVQFNASGACSVSGNTVTINGAGSCTVTATQAGDNNFNPAPDVPRSFTINKAAQATVTVSAPSDATFGQTGLFATASGGSGTGAYSFDATGSTACTVNATSGAIVINSGTGTCAITASRLGDTNFNASAASAPSSINIHKAAAVASVASNKNPSTFGDTLTFTAQVSPATATGVVQFRIDGNNFGAPVALTNGIATSGATASLTAGSHSVTAVYGGDNNFAGNAGSLTQVVNQAASSTALVSSVNLSIFGQAVVFTATVTSTGGTPTGTVTFKDGSVTIESTGLDASGHASFATAGLVAGTHSITAAYLGDNNFIISTSAPVSQVVAKSNTVTSLTSSKNPSSLLQSVTFSATVLAVAPGSGIPTGGVTFKDGPFTLATVTLNASGQAEFSTSLLLLGPHSITATYSGDANFIGSASAPLIQHVFLFLPIGSFVIGDLEAVVGQHVTFAGAQWDKANDMSGGSAPSSFKGYVDSMSTNPPVVGGTWTGRPANSSNPPEAVPEYMAVLVSSSVTKSGSTITGNIVSIVIVKPDSATAETGTVVAIIAP